jgi:catalase
MANFQRDGHMQTMVIGGRANYEPNSLAEAGEHGGPRADSAGGFTSFTAPVEGSKVRLRAESFADHYSQARLFFRSQSEVEQHHIVAAFVFELSKVTLPHVRARMVANLRNVDEALAARVAAGLALPTVPAASQPAVPPIDLPLSPGLRLIGKYPATLEGRSVALLVTDGADGALVGKLRDACEKQGATVKIVAPAVYGVTLADGSHLPADAQLAGAPSQLFDAVGVLASAAGSETLLGDSAAIDFVSNAFVHLKAIAYSREAWPLLERARVVSDDGVVPAERAAKSFVAAASTRQWAREASVRPQP